MEHKYFTKSGRRATVKEHLACALDLKKPHHPADGLAWIDSWESKGYYEFDYIVSYDGDLRTVCATFDRHFQQLGFSYDAKSGSKRFLFDEEKD